MVRRTIAATTLCAYWFWITGCTSTVREMVIRDEFMENPNDKIVEITFSNGSVVRFDEIGGHFNTKRIEQTTRTMIIGYTWDKKNVEVDLKNVIAAKIERTEHDAGKTTALVFLIVSVITGGILIVLAIAWSGE
jgi:hypothetical protein